MDFKRIELLLDRYWSCVSTLEEEEELKRFFNSEEVPAHLKQYIGLFRYFEKEKITGALDTSFDLDTVSRIRNEKSAAGKSRKLVFNYLKVAAAIGIVMIASLFFRQNLPSDQRPELLGTYQDPKEAFEETKRVLMLVAGKLNRGKKYIETVGSFNEAKEKIEGQSTDEDQTEKKNNNKQL